jgi:hypothetical protein
MYADIADKINLPVRQILANLSILKIAMGVDLGWLSFGLVFAARVAHRVCDPVSGSLIWCRVNGSSVWWCEKGGVGYGAK